MKAKTHLARLAACALVALGLSHAPAGAAEHEPEITDFSFSFEGPLGRFDQSQLQRGLQVYTEVCSACHGLKFVSYRTLANPGGPAMSEEQMRAYAAERTVTDATTGEDRPATPTDYFPVSSLPNAPDLSLMAKARAGFRGPVGLGFNQILYGMGGPEHIASIVTDFTGEEKEEAGVTLYGNRAFPGGWMAMAPPLSDDQVTYADGTPATVEQMAQDVAAFLMWTAEPHMMARKQAGMVAVLFLAVLAVLLYLTNKKLWSPFKGRKHSA